MKRFRLARMLLAFALLLAGVLLENLASLALPALLCGIAALLIAGYDVILSALRNIKRGEIFDENFLMTIAAIGAVCIGESTEGAAVMIFYQIGEFFQDKAVNSARNSIADLMDIRPDYANLIRNGEAVRVDPFDVAVGDSILVRPGEKIPLDGVITEGESALDTAALTGESVPRNIRVGDEALSGCINLNGVLTLRVEKEFSESTASKIIDMVENAAANKSQTEAFITKFARYYTPIVTFSALALAIIPSLVTGDWSTWVYRALSFLVISCPCALVISVPMSFFGGIGAASKHGVLVKGGNYLETLANAETIVMDKTGTLTKGSFAVQQVVATNGFTQPELLALAAAAEQHSSHPIATSILHAYADTPREALDVQEISGHGVMSTVDDKVVLAGNEKLLAKHGITADAVTGSATIVHLAVDGVYAGYLAISDELKPDAKSAIAALQSLGIQKVVMLTGDREAVAAETAQTLGISDYRAQLLPGDKVAAVEQLLGTERKGSLIFVGDGINDAPVLARADVGIAMGALGSDAAVEAADVVLMDDSPAKIAEAIDVARATLRNARQNIVLSLTIKLGFLILVAVGISNMWLAVFADVGVALLAILNAMRILKK